MDWATAVSKVLPARSPYATMTEEPYLQGSGPAECSSCTELSVLPEIIWDVNGYYRELGVHPRATRKELRVAYQRINGQASPRLTYVFRQLLQDDVRRAYDLSPLGEPFMDEYVEAALNLKMREELSRRMAQMALNNQVIHDGTEESLVRDIYAEMGMDADFPDTPDEMVANGAGLGEDVTKPAKQVPQPQQEIPFSYSFYLWRTRLRDETRQLRLLARWQEHLVRAFSEQGVKTKFAVGFHGRMAHPWLQARVGYREVFFLNHLEPPTASLARDVAVRVAADLAAEQNPSLVTSN